MAVPSDKPTTLPLAAARGWDRFWFAPTDPTPLACVRVLCGLVVLYVHLCYSYDLLGYVGKDAWIPHEMATYVRDEIPIYRYGVGWTDGPELYSKGNYFWSVYHQVSYGPYVWAVHVLFLVSMALFTLGLWTPYTGLLTWVGAMSYVQRATSTVFGLDSMMMIVLAYLQVGPSGAVLSLDRWLEERRARRDGRTLPPPGPSVSANFALRLIQVHFAFIYLASGTSKLLGSTWWSGTSLNLVVLNPAFAPMDWRAYYNVLSALAENRWAWELVMSASIVGTLLLEVGFMFVVWDRRWTWLLVAGGAGLHTGIGILMGLTTFSLMMFVMLIAFVPPDVLKEVLTGLARKPSPAAG